MLIRLMDLSIYDGQEFEVPDGTLTWQLPEPTELSLRGMQLLEEDTPATAPPLNHRVYKGVSPAQQTPRQQQDGGVVFVWEGLIEPLNRFWGGNAP